MLSTVEIKTFGEDFGDLWKNIGMMKDFEIQDYVIKSFFISLTAVKDDCCYKEAKEAHYCDFLNCFCFILIFEKDLLANVGSMFDFMEQYTPMWDN